MAADLEKLAQMILFFASHEGVVELGATKLHKLIYFSDVTHLREYGTSISNSEYIKYPQGPVPSRGEKVIKKLEKSESLSEKREILALNIERRALRAISKPNLRFFSETELNVMRAICKRFGRKTASDLSNISHTEPAWICAPQLQKLSPSLMMYGPEEEADGL